MTGESPDDKERIITPESPVKASLSDIVQFAWLVAIPEAYAAGIVGIVVRELTAAKDELVRRLEGLNKPAQAGLLARYGNHDSRNGMASVAGTVVGTLASMVQLHANLKAWGNLSGVLEISDPSLWQPTGNGDAIPHRIAAEWRKIETVDYRPLSTIAAQILEDSDLGARLGPTMRLIHDTITGYVSTGIGVTTNVAAEIWQSMIPDRDQRAAYYTKPIVAELLAGLTVARLEHPAEARYNEICAGTGTLARATEEHIRFRHYAADGNKASIHARRMEGCIQLTDLNQQSISVATANMTSLEPETAFDSSAIFAITANGGALNFLKPEGVSNLIDQIIGRNGAQGEMLGLEPLSAGICCNNDPYFRPRGGVKSPIDSQAMKSYRTLADKRVPGVANGQAGLATFMHVIEHALLDYGSPHGKVLPLTAAHAETYRGFRRNIENEYRDVVAICTSPGGGESMSADTAIQEMLLVGTKRPDARTLGGQAVACINLTRTFQTKLEAKMFADAIRRELAEGKPNGEIHVGGIVGTYYRMEGLGEGKPWSALGSSGDFTILTGHLTNGRAWDAATGQITEFAMPMTTLSGVSAKGPTHDLLGCLPASRDPRGAFVMHPAGESNRRNNPSLWECHADKQVSLTVEPTHYGESRGDAGEASRMLETAGNFHLCRNLRMSSQKVAMAYTETPCMGGRSWTTIKADGGVAEALAIYLNSTYGMVVRVGYGNSTIVGRATLQVRAIDAHPVPDFSDGGKAGQTARRIARENFDKLRRLNLDRVAMSVLDPHRAEIDRVATLMLGLPWNIGTERMLHEWRRLFCVEPAVNGGNKGVLAALDKAGLK